MGREIRRVPLDFEWELNKRWEGFLNPLGKACPEDQKTCFNGETSASQWLSALLRILVVAADDALDGGKRKERGGNFPHPYLVELPTAPTYEIPKNKDREVYAREWARRTRDRENFVLPPSKDLADLVSGFTEPDSYLKSFLGGSANFEIRKALIVAAKLDPETWGICPVCKGQAMDPAVQEAYDAWEETPPPEGEGWQLWETVSEGSPVSPVLPTREAFIEYLMSLGSTRSAAEAFVTQGWVPSGVSMGGGPIVSGIEAAEVMQNK